MNKYKKFRYLSSVRKRQTGGASIDEEEAQLISGLKLDLADIYTFDDELDHEFELQLHQ